MDKTRYFTKLFRKTVEKEFSLRMIKSEKIGGHPGSSASNRPSIKPGERQWRKIELSKVIHSNYGYLQSELLTSTIQLVDINTLTQGDVLLWISKIPTAGYQSGLVDILNTNF
jgi:hypothetical protein